MQKDWLKLSIQLILLVLFCACKIDNSDHGQARQTLITFFDKLSEGDYDEAVQLFGGSYEVLESMNPEVDPQDRAMLWRNGCQINGLQCLDIRRADFVERNDEGAYIFSVEFNIPDLNLFVREGCCDTGRAPPPDFRFEYRVILGSDGVYRVLDMPIYIP
jgi:hypothetical protein